MRYFIIVLLLLVLTGCTNHEQKYQLTEMDTHIQRLVKLVELQGKSIEEMNKKLDALKKGSGE